MDVKLIQIDHVVLHLRDVNSANSSFVMLSRQKNAFDYRSALEFLILPGESYGGSTIVEVASEGPPYTVF